MSNMYAGLRRDLGNDATVIERCSSRLMKMRKSLSDLRARRSDGNLLLATWNIRDFDSNKFGFGPRLPETFYYIAEIMASFDLIAVQEVNRDMSALERVIRILGRQWDYLVTDSTKGPGGNQERMAFVYNKEKVWFRRVAGEVVLPDGQLIRPAEDVAKTARPESKVAGQQFARSPFLVAFQSGWFRFSLCTVHIYYGKDSGAELTRRIAEIEALVKFFADRQDQVPQQEKDRSGNVENYILLGDFNVVSPKHKTMEALTKHGFEVPKPIDGDKLKNRDHYYDQIAVRVKDTRFEVGAGGIVNIFEDVFRDDPADIELYAEHMPKKDPEKGEFAATNQHDLYKKWRTWQMSDHSPLWIEIKTDFSDNYLRDLGKGG